MSRSAHRKPDERRVSFGRYEGKLYAEVPLQYLQWFVANSYHQMQNRRKWAQEEIDRRNRMCLKKRPITTLQKAEGQARDQSARTKDDIRAYKCSYCDFWHTGHVIKKEATNE